MIDLNDTPTGAHLLCWLEFLLDRPSETRSTRQRIYSCTLTSDGFCIGSFQEDYEDNETRHTGAFLGVWQEVSDNLVQWANHFKLDAYQRDFLVKAIKRNVGSQYHPGVNDTCAELMAGMMVPTAEELAKAFRDYVNA